ncbi:ATP-binding cassette domain-containing protein [Buchnera aphidicola]|uniref:ATP-binding cassette domain-containing protein n=1 Tax=Buchnera aphidicola TaxID=9 RepID=UPI0031B700AB
MLVNIKNGKIKFNKIPILNNINLIIHQKEKICVLGNNGSGKSTLLKIIKKKILLDAGSLFIKKDLKIAYLSQNLPKRSKETIYEFLCKNINKKYRELINFQNFSIKKKSNLKNFNNFFNINEKKIWKKYSKIKKIMKILQLKKNTLLNSLSGGWLKKVNLAKILIQKSDLLLLDEPTNHLDITSIEWLEKYLLKYKGAILFTSHDREFIHHITHKIIYINFKTLNFWKIKNFNDFFKKLKLQENINNIKNLKFQKKIKKEEIWSKKGIKARRTRNEGRLKKFIELKNEYDQIEKTQESYPILINSLERSNKIIFNLKNISLIRNQKYLIKNFSEKIIYGDKISLIGSNGCGKSSFLKLLLKKINLTSGKIKIGKNIKISYFDQERKNLNKKKTILENFSTNLNNIKFKNQTYNIFSLLKKFNFSTEKIYSLVQTLSGGEINRLLFLKIFLKPSHVLILDEPTNDLDFTTLSFLEKILKSYPGTIFLVSHDRNFIKNISKKFWYFQKNGKITIDLNYYPNIYKKSINTKKKIKKKNKKKKNLKDSQKLTYKLKKELKNLPQELEEIEAQIQKIEKKIIQKNFYQQNPIVIKKIFLKLSNKKKKIKKKFLRWEFLENLKK